MKVHVQSWLELVCSEAVKRDSRRDSLAEISKAARHRNSHTRGRKRLCLYYSSTNTSRCFRITLRTGQRS